MKRILLMIIFCLLICPSLLLAENLQLARMNPYVAGAITIESGGACSTSNDSKLWNPITQPGDISGADSVYDAVKITLAAETTITGYLVRICDKGSNTGSSTTSLYNDDGEGATSKPTTEIAGTSKSLASSVFPDCTTTTPTFFELAVPKVVAAGTYWIVNKAVDYASRDIYYAASWTASAVDRVCYGTASPNESCINDYAYDMELWGCQ